MTSDWLQLAQFRPDYLHRLLFVTSEAGTSGRQEFEQIVETPGKSEQ
jgi:hypothetical protein